MLSRLCLLLLLTTEYTYYAPVMQQADIYGLNPQFCGFKSHRVYYVAYFEKMCYKATYQRYVGTMIEQYIIYYFYIRMMQMADIFLSKRKFYGFNSHYGYAPVVELEDTLH